MKARLLMALLVPILVLCLFAGRNRTGLPNGLRGVVPVYPGAEIASTMRLTASAGAHASFRTKATPASILTYYRDAMRGKGWSIGVERESFLALFKGTMGLMIDVGESSLGSNLVTMVIVRT